MGRCTDRNIEIIKKILVSLVDTYTYYRATVTRK